MSDISYSRTVCALCGGPVDVVLDLGESPLADEFTDTPDEVQHSFPLKVQHCAKCGLAQLSEVVKNDMLFKDDYAFFTGGSPSAVKHFDEMARSLRAQFPELTDKSTIEIASNDGTFLKAMTEAGAAHVLGIDPADSVQAKAAENGVETIHGFFNRDLADAVATAHGKADLLVASNVLAHVDDLNDFAKGVDALLSSHGVFVAEFQYFPELVKRNLFDNVYHEHRFYLSIGPVAELFAQFGMNVFKVEDVDTQGGSVRVFIDRSIRFSDDSVAAHLHAEADLKLSEDVGKMQSRADEVRTSLLDELYRLKREGKVVYGYGASAKGNTLLNFCRITPELVPIIADMTPYKFGKYSPGMHLRVMRQDVLIFPDYYLMLVHNYADAIIEREQTFINDGHHFIIPIPQVTIKPSDI